MTNAKTLIFELLPKVAGDIGAVGKNGVNRDQKYKFRGIDDFLNAAHVALTKHGVTIIPRVVQRDVVRGQTKSGTPNIWIGLTAEFAFYATDGSSVSAIITSEGLDTSDKATNKALSAALKYALIQVFSIPTVDIDEADNDSPELSVPGPTRGQLVRDLTDVIKAKGLETSDVLDEGIKFFDVPADQVAGFAIRKLNDADLAGFIDFLRSL